MLLIPGFQTIPYHLGWAGFALAFGLTTWSRWQLATALTWYTVVTGVLIGRGWLLGRIGWDETTEIPLMVLMAALMVWHARRRQAALAHVTRLAEIDGLTSLANRGSFNADVSASLEDASGQDTTVLFVDLDDFKNVNDVFGHGAGDDLLREVAERLRGATRPGDVCARLGGDEFAVLLRDTDSATGAEVARRIVAAVGVTMKIGDRIARVGASVGVATATATSETDLEELVHRADVAMYSAKAGGKGRIQVFEPGLLQVDATHVAFEVQLAAAADNGELVVHYQPILSLPDRRCTAVEALVRWQHPDRGLLFPDSFIQAAEGSGAIGAIGAYVLRRACADAAAWRDTHPGTELDVHVNVSALQLDDETFIEHVKQCLADFTLAPDHLVLEVTETVVISSPVAISRLNILAAHGVRIAIDDFGTGYSALTTLRSLPTQIVKIDRSFVAGSMENAMDRAVIEAVVKMAAQMGMRTIAEGVERLEQQRFLEGIGADAVQGFLYLRPTSANEFGAWLDEHLANLSQPGSAREVVLPFTPRHTA
jgi:diguanylate cyclase (GGDEF)-like protein